MNTLFGGDFQFLWPQNIKDFVHLPSAWDSFLNTGLGEANLTLWLNSYVSFTTSFSYLGLSWITIVLIFWILPVFLGSFLFTFLLFRHLFPQLRQFAFLAGFIYAVNTYILMVVFGGQMGIGLAYAVAPLVLLAFIRVFTRATLTNSLLAGLALSLQILFDPRFVYMTMFGVFGYWIFVCKKFEVRYLIYCFVIPFICALLLHTFWLLPLILGQTSSVAKELGSSNEFNFFSFADFSQTLSLLHPNWPENIFGKTYFMRPEFLFLPILAYSSLLFITRKFKEEQVSRKVILFFAVLGLFGSFLAKGDNEPFAQINQFLFSSLPGMHLFRDPTKWYILVALSYSILIPFSIGNIFHWLKSRQKMRINYVANIFLVVIVGLLFFLIRPVWLGQVDGIFKTKQVPQEYINLTQFLVEDDGFFRTLWIPQWQRYGISSLNHPSLSSSDFFVTASHSAIISAIGKKQTQQQLQDASVKYIIVPYDSEGDIFLQDRKYDEKSYQKTLQEVREIPWLVKEKDFGKIAIFELEGYKDHFWVKDLQTIVHYQRVNPTKYLVTFENANKGDIVVFSEGYNSGWKAEQNSNLAQDSITSIEYDDRLNSFVLPQSGNYQLSIFYEPQNWVKIGGWISLITFISIVAALLIIKKRDLFAKKKNNN